jgi:protein TonB
LGGVLGGRGDEVVDAQTVAKPPGLLERALPEYPVEARVKRIEGQVLLRAIVGRDGNVEPTVEVLSSVPELDAAAIDALRKWRFTPGHDRDGNPVRVRIDVPMRFQLKQR